MSLMTSPIDVQEALSYRRPIGHEFVNRLVSEMFSIKVAHTDTLTENKGRLKVAAREPIMM